MSLFGREPGPVYRVYAEDEYDGETESFTADGQTEPFIADGHTEPFPAQAETEPIGAAIEPGGEGQPELAGFDSHSTGSGPGHVSPALAARGFEPRRRPVALLLVGLILAVAAIAALLVVSSASRRAARRSLTATTPVETAVHPRSPAARPTPTLTPRRPRSSRQSDRLRRPVAVAGGRGSNNARAAAVLSVTATLAAPPQYAPAPSALGEFGFER